MAVYYQVGVQAVVLKQSGNEHEQAPVKHKNNAADDSAGVLLIFPYICDGLHCPASSCHQKALLVKQQRLPLF